MLVGMLLWLGGAALALLLLTALLNYGVDPGGIYRRGVKQPRNLRARKLTLLRGLKRRPAATVILGSSRVFNLGLSGDERFPQPTLNMSVTTAKAEDYLACYNLMRAAQDLPPRLVLIGIEHPAFHPAMSPQWEAWTAGTYTAELQRIGAIPAGDGWRWPALLSHVQLRMSLSELQRRWRQRRGSGGAKFRWHADGTAQWQDLLEGKRNPRLLARQLRTFPRTGLGLRTYREPGGRRLAWFEDLLRQCAAEQIQVAAYVVPVHPLLKELTDRRGFAPVHQQLCAALEAACAAHGARFADWYDPALLGLDESHFRDVMHLTDAGQGVVAAALARLHIVRTQERL